MVPICFLSLILKKERRLFVVYIAIGVTVALLVSELNSLMLHAFHDDENYVTTVLTPISEELLKMQPILFYALVFSRNQDTLIPLALSIGIGFATFENMTILIQNIDNVTFGWALIRGFSSSLVHSICTMTVAFGLSFTRKNKKLFYCGIVAVFIMVCVYHGIFNMLMQSQYKYVAVILPSLTFIPFMVQQYKFHNIHKKG